MIRDTLLEHPLVYLAWQAPFIEEKLRPVFQHNDMSRVRRVLDVGCGPGTNAAHFHSVDYLGLDLNPKYIERAQRKYARSFQVADVTTYAFDRKFDFVLMNSLLHHRRWTMTAAYISSISCFPSGEPLLIAWHAGTVGVTPVVSPSGRTCLRDSLPWRSSSHTASRRLAWVSAI
jgi:SAM-dependent methyltransferase